MQLSFHVFLLSCMAKVGWGWVGGRGLWGAGRYGCTVAVVDIFYFLWIMDSVLSLSLDALIHSETHDFVNILKQLNFPSAGNFVNSDDDETPYAETSFNFSYIDEMVFVHSTKTMTDF